MSAALSDLVARVKQNMYSFSQAQQQYTYLSNGIGSTDTTFTVNDSTQISRGEIEVGGSELMYVKTFNNTSNLVTLLPTGRGWGGSTAASWAAGSAVENNPVFPYIRIVEAINDAIHSVYPDLYAVEQTTLSKVSVQFGYPLPADCEEIISVCYATIGPSMVDPWCRRWRYNNNADTTRFPTGKSVDVMEFITPGRDIVVTYMKEPSDLVNPTDGFAAVSGLPESSKDYIVYAACAKLAVSLDVARLLLNSAEVSERASYAQAGSASKVSQYFGELAQQRLQQEVRKLADRYPRPVHYDG